MASQITNYQCPRCTGPMHFDSESGMVKCEYCEGVFTVEEVEQLFQEKNERAEQAMADRWQTADAGSEWGSEGANLRTYSCPSCGAQLDCDDTTAATECPYCGNPTIIPSQLSGSLKPDLVIPFKISRQQALDALHQHYGGKKLLPKVFSQENHLEKIQGVYVPFWLYEGEAVGAVTYSGELVHVSRSGDVETTTAEEYRIYREGNVAFEHLPVDASQKMNDALMESLEPYDMSELKPFSMSYLPGYLADHFDVDKENCAQRADQRATNSARACFRATVKDGYANVHTLAENLEMIPKGAKCALLPVWMLTTRWNNETYTFAMNGQTGKFVGDLPVDKGLKTKYRLLYGGGIAVVLYALQWAAALL